MKSERRLLQYFKDIILIASDPKPFLSELYSRRLKHIYLLQCVVWYGAVSLTSVPARLSVARLINAGDRVTAEERVISAPLHNTVILHCKEPASEPPAVLTWWKEGSKVSLIQIILLMKLL